MATKDETVGPPRPTAQAHACPEGQTPPSGPGTQAESGADDRDGRLADLGKERENRAKSLTELNFCQVVGMSEDIGQFALGADAEALIAPNSFDALILVEAILPQNSRGKNPLRAAIAASRATLGAFLIRLVLWTQGVEAQGVQVRAQILRRDSESNRPTRTAVTSNSAELRQVCVGILYEDASKRYDRWAARGGYGIVRPDRPCRFHDAVLLALEALAVNELNLGELRLAFGFAHRDVIDARRRIRGLAHRFDRFQGEVRRELGWDESYGSLVLPPEEQIVQWESEAAEERRRNWLPQILRGLMMTERRKAIRDACLYWLECLHSSAKPTRAGLAAVRGVDPSNGSRLWKEVAELVRVKLHECEEAYLKSS